VRDEDPAAHDRSAFEAAKLAFERLGDADGAFQRLEPLASAGYEDAEVLIGRIAFEAGKTDALVAFLTNSANRYDDLLAVLRALAERSADPHARAELYLRCARLLVGTLGDPLGAIEAYREVLGAERTKRPCAFCVKRRRTSMTPPSSPKSCAGSLR